MTAIFSENSVIINSSGQVYKSEDGENYSLLFNGGNFIDKELCLPSIEESPNYYFYSGDSTIVPVLCKTY